MSSSSFFHAPHPLVPLAKLNVSDPPQAALEGHSAVEHGADELALVDEQRWQNGGASTYALFPSSPGRSDSAGDTGDHPPDFLGKLHHMKTLFRMSATTEPVSMMIHRVGPMLILDDGPCGWSRGDSPDHSQPSPPSLRDADDGIHHEQPIEDASHLMVAALDQTLRSALAALPVPTSPPPPPPPGLLDGLRGACAGEHLGTPVGGPPPGLGAPGGAAAVGSCGLGLALPEPPASELLGRVYVKNTFLDIASEEGEEELPPRSHSAPAGPQANGVPEDVAPPTLLAGGRAGILGVDASLSDVVQQIQEHAERAASRWSLIPYQQPDAAAAARAHAGDDGVLEPKHWDLLQCSARDPALPNISATLEAIRALYADIPPQPSRFGRAVDWRCGPYRILLGCDLVVLRSGGCGDSSEFASFKMRPPGAAAGPSREEKMDVYLENMMCDINKVVWGSHNQGQLSWRVFDTADLPDSEGDRGVCFDAETLENQGQRLLHFLRQKCHREGGTYWLFREANSTCAELFDLTASSADAATAAAYAGAGVAGEADRARSFGASPSLAAPLATLCFQLAKSMQDSNEHRQLLQKALQLLEPVKEEHPALYAMASFRLADSYMRSPMPAILDGAPTSAPPSRADGGVRAEAQNPVAGRMALALGYLEGVLRLLTSLTDGARSDLTLLAELRLQGHVAYAECVLRLVREACIPTYSAWLAEVQRASQELLARGCSDPRSAPRPEAIAQMKRLSAAFLLWRLFWLVRAHRALAILSTEKREIECWTLDRDLCETTGDTLYGLSRFPAGDVDDLLSGRMSTAAGICKLVEEGLCTWGLSGGGEDCSEAPDAKSAKKKHKKHGNKRLASSPSPERSQEPSGDADGGSRPHNVNAMFLSKLNPLERGVGDEAVRDDPLARDDLRRALWTDGKALRQSLALYERATARLRRSEAREEEGVAGHRRAGEDQAMMKIARKLAHLYNEEARAALAFGDAGNTEEAERLLTQAHRWMMLSGDHSNASRVMLNLSELHARFAERLVAAGDGGDTAPFSEEQYQLWLKAIDCCESAARLSENALGRREGAFAHLRVGVHLSLRVPTQERLNNSKRNETLAELADRHFGKALRAFDELREEREIAVCHFHMADLVLQELRIADAPPLPKSRLTVALRHARRSAEHWEKAGALQYAKDFAASHVRIARLLECQQRAGAIAEACDHLFTVEAQLLELAANSSTPAAEAGRDGEDLFKLAAGRPVAVTPFRREMGRLCQAGLRRGEDVERLKALYRRVLRNEPGPAAP